jgi:hypothetical protein
LFGTIIAAVLVDATIAVIVTLVQQLRQHHWLVQWLRKQWHWRSDCGNGVGAVIAVAALVQQLQEHWCSDCSNGSVGAAITAAAGLVQRLRQQWYWCSDCGSIGAAIAVTVTLVQQLQQRQNDFP